MQRSRIIANSILWAAAIIAAALLGAPVSHTLIVLPSLATGSLIVSLPAPRPRDCAR